MPLRLKKHGPNTIAHTTYHSHDHHHADHDTAPIWEEKGPVDSWEQDGDGHAVMQSIEGGEEGFCGTGLRGSEVKVKAKTKTKKARGKKRGRKRKSTEEDSEVGVSDADDDDDSDCVERDAKRKRG